MNYLDRRMAKHILTLGKKNTVSDSIRFRERDVVAVEH